MSDIPEPFASIPFGRVRYPTASPIHEFARWITPPAPVESNSGKPELQVRTWAKREDQSAPLICCGNKYRKLEYIIPDILKTPGVTTVVTEGGLQSNHAAQTAVVAAKLGLECVLLLDEHSGGLDSCKRPDIFRATGNFQVYNLLGAQIQIYSRPYDKDSILKELEANGKVPYWIPSGSSLHPLGGLGYARCAFEIATQESELNLEGTGRFDYIFLPCGSGSTLGGLLAGFQLLEKREAGEKKLPPRQIIGVMASPKTNFEETVLSIAQIAGDHIGLEKDDLTLEQVRLDHRFYGPGYGVFDSDTQSAQREIATKDGVLMDPVYSGKAANGMLSYLRSGELKSDAIKRGYSGYSSLNVLMIHTGGQTVFSAYTAQ